MECFFVYFVVPETKNIPLEEMAKLFGDTDDIAVYAEDIHLDPTTHQIVTDEHGHRRVFKRSDEDIEAIANGAAEKSTSSHVEMGRKEESQPAFHVDKA